MDDAATNAKPGFALVDHGWRVEPTDEGVRLERSGWWRVAMIGCSFLVGLFVLPVLFLFWFFGGRFWHAPEGGVWQILWLAIPLTFVGIMGLLVGAWLLHILKIALWREQWEAGPDFLIIRRGLLGFLRSRELRGGRLLIEPHYEGAKERKWRLAALCDGEKHYLVRGAEAPFGVHAMHDKQAEVTAIANLLAEHTGWSVARSAIAIDGGSPPPAECNEEELLAALRSRRYLADLDEYSRLTIRPPVFGRLIGGLFFLAIGIGWLWFMTDATTSFINDAKARQQPLANIFFWLLMVPMLMIGVALCAGGIATFFSRVRWTVDRNLFLVNWRLFGWSWDREYFSARWRLTAITRTRQKGGTYTIWQLQLENQTGATLKVLMGNSDDDIPRLLGALFAQRTGWPLSEAP